MSKREVAPGVWVNWRTKPLASDSYKKYPCDTPGCTGKVEGYRDDMGWVNARKVRDASIAEFGGAFCQWCKNEKREANGTAVHGHAKSPEEQARELQEFMAGPATLKINGKGQVVQ
jgi:hypothetical protein